MRKSLMLGVGVMGLGLSGLAMAQPAPSVPPSAPAAEAPPHPGPAHGDRAEGPRGPRGPHGMMPGLHSPPPPPGSSFAFRRGDTMVRIHCSDRQPLQECVAAANGLFDKFNAAPR